MPTKVMVGEKPKVASRIAQALGDYSIEENRGVKNYVIDTDDGELIIAPAVGHIFNLDQVEDGWDYPVFEVEWKPIFETSDSADYVKKYYNNLKDQLEKADEYINACDFDLEGCLHPEENIIIRKDGEIKTVKSGDIIDSIIETRETEEQDSFEYSKADIEILGMEDWSVGFQDVEKVMRRPSDEKYLEITLFNGREVNVSKNHPMLIATGNGLEHRKAGELDEGDYVLSSTSVPSDQSKSCIDLINTFEDIYIHSFKEEMDIMPAEMAKHVDKTRKQCLNYRYNDRMPKEIFLELEEYLGVERENLTISTYKGSTRLPAKLQLDRKLGRFLGLYLAEGCIDSGGFIGLYFGPEEDELVKEVQNFLEQKIKTEGKTRKREVEGSYGDSECYEVGTKSKILKRLLEEFKLGRDSGSKRMPDWILSSPREFKEGILSGYWDGDGSLFIDNNDNRAIASAGSKNKELLDQIFYLLQTEGINASFQRWSERDMTNLTIGRNKDIRRLSQEFLEVGEEFSIEMKSTLTYEDRNSLKRVPKCLAKRQGKIECQDSNIKNQSTFSVTDVSDWESGMSSYPDGDTTFLEVKNIEKKESECSYFYDFQTESRNYQHGNGVVSHNSVIGSNVIKHITGASNEQIQRMRFSTLTPEDLQEAFDNLDDFDHGMTEAGLTRHVLDYYYGINVSRALMKAVRSNDRYKTLSTGRVQGPTLKVLAEREREIQKFEPDPYWEIYLNHSEFQAQWEDDEDRIWEEEVAENIFDKVKDEKKTEVTNIKVNNYKHNPPVPFNLTGLQSEASSQFNISPKKTQSLAQDLYEQGLISYPRTESQKLPAKLGYETLLKKLKKQDSYEEKAKKVLKKDEIYPRQGKKEDDAHPAIHPTGEHPSGLSKQQRQVFDLVVKRFFSVFGEAAKRRTLTMTLTVEEEEFKAKSKITVERNWFELYDPYVKVDEAELPELDEGDVLDIEGFDLEEKETQPPRRYSQSKIVNELEKRNLGTKATRAQTVDRLYDRNYIENQPIEVTDLGLVIVDTLEDYSPGVVSEELTREFEEKMDSIREGDNSREDVLGEAQDKLVEILTGFKENEKEIGEKLVDTIDQERRRRRQLGPCDQCEDGTLRILKKNGSRFVGCSNYPDCENTYPLPGNGKIESLKETCDECHTPKIKVIRKNRKPYTMCIDPDCPTKDDW